MVLKVLKICEYFLIEVNTYIIKEEEGPFFRISFVVKLIASISTRVKLLTVMRFNVVNSRWLLQEI